MWLFRGLFGKPSPVPVEGVNTFELFHEEPLSLSGDQSFGFFPARAGTLLKDGRYEILRKLGRGQCSTTWLVLDSQGKKAPVYYSVKILTVHATKSHPLELEILKAINKLKVTGLPHLFDHFETEGPHGLHRCLVQPVLSTDVGHFRRSAPTERLGSPTVKIIIVQVLEALVALHAAQIVHTDLKPSNVLFCDGTSPTHIRKLLESSPLVVNGELELHGASFPIIRSQPVPHPFNWNDPPKLVELYYVRLVDFGHAQWTDREPTTRTISEPDLRAPEVILGANFDAKVDIWSLGCMTFELLTGHRLFNPKGGQAWRTEDDHLAKMMGVTGVTFSETMLSASRRRDEYFDKDGKLCRIDQILPLSLEQAMIDYGLSEAEVVPAANFIRTCLHLNPEERSSARDLIAHPWLERAFMGC